MLEGETKVSDSSAFLFYYPYDAVMVKALIAKVALIV